VILVISASSRSLSKKRKGQHNRGKIGAREAALSEACLYFNMSEMISPAMAIMSTNDWLDLPERDLQASLPPFSMET
jgi:hypothetical protein